MPMAVDMPYKAGNSPTWITLPHEYSLPCTVRKKHVALALEDRGKDSELTKAEWEGAQLVLNACKKEFEKFSGQLKTILKDIGCNDPKDHLFLKVILTLVYLLLACNCK